MLIRGRPAAIVCALLTAGSFDRDPHRSVPARLADDAVIFRCVAVGAAMFAALRCIEARSGSAVRSMSIGVACIIVASFAALIVSSLNERHPMGGGDRSNPAAVVATLWLDVQLGALLVVITHAGSSVLTEHLGGICGHRLVDLLKSSPE